jgi:tetratricopeptide (TPR) repeat protein
MRAVTTILPTLIPTAVPDVEAAWVNRPPQAVAHFLEGEAAFRRVRLPEALEAFQAAIEADSTFGLAGMRGAQVAAWNHESGAAAALVNVALRQDLSERDRRFAQGLQAYLDGRADSAVSDLRHALALDPSMVVAWLQLGEVYMHRLPSTGPADSLAEDAFDHALALDSSAAAPQFHLVELRARRGDQPGAAAVAQQFVRTAVDTELVREVEIVSKCGADGFTGVDLREAARRRPLPLLLSGKYLGPSPLTMPCALTAYAALLEDDTASTVAADGRRYFATLGVVSGLLQRGRTDEAVAAIEWLQQRQGEGMSLYLLAAPVYPALADSARAVARRDSIEFGANYAGLSNSPSAMQLWRLGVWAAVDAHPELAEEVARELWRRAAAGTALDTLIARSVAAHAALAGGDTVQALNGFETLVSRPSLVNELAWIQAASLGFDRLTLGRLLISRGEYARALTVLDVLDSAVPAAFPLYLEASLTARIEATESLQQAAQATTLRARLAAVTGG